MSFKELKEGQSVITTIARTIILLILLPERNNDRKVMSFGTRAQCCDIIPKYTSTFEISVFIDFDILNETV